MATIPMIVFKNIFDILIMSEGRFLSIFLISVLFCKITASILITWAFRNVDASVFGQPMPIMRSYKFIKNTAIIPSPTLRQDIKTF